MRMKNSFIASLLTLWLLTELTGCTSMSPPAPATSNVTWQARQPLLSKLQNWQLSGKLAIITAKDSGSANVDWTEHAGRYTISLYGPLGANAITLKGTPSLVTMKTSDGKTATAHTPEELLAQQWGWHLPLSYIKYWVRGLPVPHVAAQNTFDGAHRLATLSQQGFRIQYQGYTTANGLELPQRMVITSSSIKSKIIIYRWNLS